MRRVQWVVGLMMALGSTSAAAQQIEERVEISGGWRLYQSRDRTPGNIMLDKDASNGWFVDTAVKVLPKFAMVGEVGGTYQQATFGNTAGISPGRSTLVQNSDVRFHTFLGGARVLAPQRSWIVPFGQVLFGWQRDRFELETLLSAGGAPPAVINSEFSFSDQVLAFDGGATVGWRRFGVRASLGYARFCGAADLNALRLSVGATTRF